MSIRHKNYIDTYERMDIFLSSSLKQQLANYKREQGISMTRIISCLLEKFFRGEIEIKLMQPTKIHSYKKEAK